MTITTAELTTRVQEFENSLDKLMASFHLVAEERDRLATARADWKAEAKRRGRQRDEAIAERDKLRAEVEKLKGWSCPTLEKYGRTCDP